MLELREFFTYLFYGMYRTPDMSAMHQDTSSDLKVVGNKLRDILEVFTCHSVKFFHDVGCKNHELS